MTEVTLPYGEGAVTAALPERAHIVRATGGGGGLASSIVARSWRSPDDVQALPVN